MLKREVLDSIIDHERIAELRSNMKLNRHPMLGRKHSAGSKGKSHHEPKAQRPATADATDGQGTIVKPVVVAPSYATARISARRIAETKKASLEFMLDGNASYEPKELNSNDIKSDIKCADRDRVKFDIARPALIRWGKAQGRRLT